MSYPIGSSVFLSLSLFFLSLLVLLLLRYYLPLRKTPAFLVLSVFFAIFLPASLILLVPVDLGSTLLNEDAWFGIDTTAHSSSGHKTALWLPERSVLVMWRITYWLIFVLTWIILPFLSEYLDSYHPTPHARTIASLRANAKYHLFLLALAVSGILYVTISYGLRLASLKSLIMALAYIWGLALAIYLMGHGLVAVPRHIWRKRHYGAHLRRLHTRAVRIWDALVESKSELAEVERMVTLVGERKERVADVSLITWVEQLARDVTFNAAEIEAGRGAAVGHTGLTGMETAFPPASTEELRAKIPAVVTENYLANLSRRLHRARHRHARFVSEWTRLIQDAVDTQAVIDSVAKGTLEFGPRIRDQVMSMNAGAGAGAAISSPSSFISSFAILSPSMRCTFYLRILPPLRVILSAFLSLASLSIVLSEIFKSIFPPLSIVSLSIFPRTTFSNSSQYTFTFTQQLTTAFWLMYMSLCALWTLMTTPLTWRQRALVPRNTHGESAAWYAGQVARLTVPMAYNFVTLLPEEVRRKTVFYGFLGRWVDFTSLGKGVDRGFPIFILVPVLLGLFDVYGKVGRKLGLSGDDYDSDGDVGDGDGDGEDSLAGDRGTGFSTWMEGRQLIEQELSGPGALGLSSTSQQPLPPQSIDSHSTIRGLGRGSGRTYDFSSTSISTGSATTTTTTTTAAAAAAAAVSPSRNTQPFNSSAPNFLPFSASSNARPRSSHAYDRDANSSGATSSAPLLTHISDSIADTVGIGIGRGIGRGTGTGTDGTMSDRDVQDSDDSENPFTAFAHRIKNTVETVNWPWQQSSSATGHVSTTTDTSDPGSNQGPGNVWNRMFGGGARAGGGIRL